MPTYSELVAEFGFDPWTERDRNKDGMVGSAMPAWYMPEHLIEEYAQLEEQERQIEMGVISPENIHRIKQYVAKERKKLDLIKDSFPRPSGRKLDNLAKIINMLGDDITRSMFTYSDMQSGSASAHDELKRSKDPVVPVSNDVSRWIIFCNGEVFGKNGAFRIKRDDAIRAWRIGRRILGESTWSEDLRPTERPEGVRRGDYELIFGGEFKRETPETLKVGKADPQIPQVQGEEPEKPVDPKLCDDCKGSMVGEPHLAKRCKPCREKRKQDAGREDTDKDAGGSS